MARRKGQAALISLSEAVARAFPEAGPPEAVIEGGRVRANGVVKTNPDTRVRRDVSLVLDAETRLRGTRKIEPALERFTPTLEGAVALDAGAAAGGFTAALLDGGASRVYAVDAGHGQLVASLRQDERVVALERTNVAHLDRRLVPEELTLVTLDLGYLAIASGIGQLGSLSFHEQAELIALVKPMFELRLAEPPREVGVRLEALEQASAGVEDAGWRVNDWIHSPLPGANGAEELFLYAERA